MIIEQKIKPIHPFPARMAPEIAFEALDGLSKKSIILDPMMGSGTVLRTISELGFNGIGLDIDPLALLMSKAWTTKIDEAGFLKISEKIHDVAKKSNSELIKLPWIDDDPQTAEFVKFWFASNQIADLRRLSYRICKDRYEWTPLLKVAFSRLIITKSKGASLAADVSHSRPHRVREVNDFDVFDEFLKSCNKIVRTLNSNKLEGVIQIKKGDARRLSGIKSNHVDSIITSPPYLNALDYMRGHKLSLVWLGYKIGELATIRGGSVGAEKAPEKNINLERFRWIERELGGFENLPTNIKNMVYRYAFDIQNIVKESSRVLKKDRNATFVIGNSSIKGIYINNTLIAEKTAEVYGLKLIDNKEREIPQNKRYLPPPNGVNKIGLNSRMQTETIMTFKKIK